MAADDTGGWLKRVWMWDWHELQLKGYPGWYVDPKTESPAFYTFNVRSGIDKSSFAVSVAWDDVAEVRFYNRDWTDDGIPFVDQGEVYKAGFWFQTEAERDRFAKWFEVNNGPLAQQIEQDASTV